MICAVGLLGVFYGGGATQSINDKKSEISFRDILNSLQSSLLFLPSYVNHNKKNKLTYMMPG